MDMHEELKLRDDRIERLEKAFLYLLSLTLNNYPAVPAEEYLSRLQIFAVERAESLVEDYGSSEKVIEELLSIGENKVQEWRS